MQVPSRFERVDGPSARVFSALRLFLLSALLLAGVGAVGGLIGWVTLTLLTQNRSPPGCAVP